MARKKRSRAQAAELPIHDEAASSAQHDGRVASINPPPTMATGSCNAQLEVPKYHVSNLSGRRIRTASLNALTITGSPQTFCSETWGSNCGLTTSPGRPEIARGHQAHLQLALNATAQQKLAEQPRRSGSGDASMAFNAQGRHLLGSTQKCCNSVGTPGRALSQPEETKQRELLTQPQFFHSATGTTMPTLLNNREAAAGANLGQTSAQTAVQTPPLPGKSGDTSDELPPDIRHQLDVPTDQHCPRSRATSPHGLPVRKAKMCEPCASPGLTQLVACLIAKSVEDVQCTPHIETCHAAPYGDQPQSRIRQGPIADHQCQVAGPSSATSQEHILFSEEERACQPGDMAHMSAGQSESLPCLPATGQLSSGAGKATAKSGELRHWNVNLGRADLATYRAASAGLTLHSCDQGGGPIWGQTKSNAAKNTGQAGLMPGGLQAADALVPVTSDEPHASAMSPKMMPREADEMDSKALMSAPRRQVQARPALPGLKGQTNCTGISHRMKSNQYEVYFDPIAYMRRFKIDVAMDSTGRSSDLKLPPKKRFYIGMYKFSLKIKGDKERALREAKKTLDRIKVKVLEGLVAEDTLQQELHYPLSEYQGDDEKRLRATLSLSEFRVHIANQRCVGSMETTSSTPPSSGVATTRGVHKKKDRHGQVRSFEARYTRSLKQIKSFGSYATAEEAAEAYDLGTILIFGTARRINAPLGQYLEDEKFHAHVRIPPRVKESVQSYISSMLPHGITEFEETLARIKRYFKDPSTCPFYDYRKSR